jgi:hypothetical protein
MIQDTNPSPLQSLDLGEAKQAVQEESHQRQDILQELRNAMLSYKEAEEIIPETKIEEAVSSPSPLSMDYNKQQKSRGTLFSARDHEDMGPIITKQ